MAQETVPRGGDRGDGPYLPGESFLTDYYEHVSGEDIGDYSLDVLRTRAMYHLSVAAERAPGQAAVGVLNDLDATIVAVVADDMPFLVHSVTAELTREDAAIRLLVHPTFKVRRDSRTHQLLDLRHGPSRSGLAVPEAAQESHPPAPAMGGGPADQDARSSDGRAATGTRVATETWVAVEIDRLPEQSTVDELTANLHRVLDDVRAAATDAAAIQEAVTAAVASIDSFPGSSSPPPDQVRDLLRWLDDGNFTFLGYAERLGRAEGRLPASPQAPGEPVNALGLLRRALAGEAGQADDGGLAAGGAYADGGGRGQWDGPGAGQVFTLTTCELHSSVLRASYLDELRLPIFDAAGAVNGERLFVGLFTPGASSQSVRRIPVIRDKLAAVLGLLEAAPRSQRSKDVLAVLESFPRDELFSIGVDDLTRLAADILDLQQRRRTRLFLRPDSPGRFVHALVFLPRRRYNTAVRLRMEHELRQAFRPQDMEFEVRLGDSPMARVFFRILLARGAMPDVDAAALEQRVLQATRSWTEGLDEVLKEHFPGPEAARLTALWSGAFPPSYRAEYGADDAIRDISRFEEFDLDGRGGRDPDDPALSVYTLPGPADVTADAAPPAAAGGARIRLYLTRPRSLTAFLPFFHNLGVEVLDQRPFGLRRGGRELPLYDLGVKYPDGVDPAQVGALLADCFSAAMRGDIESDSFDALVIRESVPWQQVVILRTYAKYLQQLGTTNSYGFIAETLLANVRATRALLELFAAKFDPDLANGERLRSTAKARQELLAAIDDVPVLDADRLLRTFMNLVEATLRTNYYQARAHLSIKLNPAAIHSSPLPRPKYEIWVYSPRVEGVHLRFGALARGGLRWSDRREDFRTEILGLVKAQVVKNSVIVPTGAKGGFYPKRLPDPATDRAAWLAEGQECYRIFIRGLLDLTDNLVQSAVGIAGGGETSGAQPRGAEAGGRETVVPPERVVRHDGDDYYLVVAADKGTASFSDTANLLAAEYGFWLGDAFASGGSVGYDHKQMGITARGAWESVKEHFRELGLDTQNQDFTVAGIGDMSGDVFGNGMLLSRHIRLVAAFDHRHIFLDPAPDTAAAYTERRRLFGLPRSSWADYDASLISEGGGVYSRQAKSILVTEPVRHILGLERGTTGLAPQELLQAILRAPVDLLYNGGIGTYVKAATETNADVGDKANDAIRINGSELRARVVAEGGNLGLTQRGRIEAALGGVLLNSDAIDNSAGVDCSDHEVNIKIFVDRVIAAGRMDAVERTGFLHSLTDEVARLVLKNNTDQNVLLLNDRHLVSNWSPGFERAMDWLETAADLDRNIEALPGTAELHDRLRSGQGLTAPELSVLAAYAKIELAADLVASDLADDPWFRGVLRGYFPRQLSERFGAELDTHPLRREIICTVVANDMINLGGITFAFRAIEETTATPAAVAKAFVVAREVYDLPWVVDRIAALPPEFPTEHAAEVALHMRRVLDRATRWYVTHDHRDRPVTEALARITPTLEMFRTRTVDYLRGSDLDRVQDRLAHWDQAGLPHDLGLRAADMLESFGLLDISLVSEQIREPLATITDLYYTVFQRIGAASLLLRITDLPRQNRWGALARAALRDDVYSAVADMTVSVMQHTRDADPAAPDPVGRIVAWERGHQEQLARIKDTFAEVTRPGQVDIASISVALKLLRTLVRP
ncbi:NAD-glutamate dehydrogenase [Arthrobacter sp. NPDC056493]|uniref:NAD-glutamate dehydrogenase n=1 Tax=Arthrobacter sp. NPDC056493 TaxID=3345839 RepID=UPI00366D5F1E